MHEVPAGPRPVKAAPFPPRHSSLPSFYTRNPSPRLPMRQKPNFCLLLNSHMLPGWTDKRGLTDTASRLTDESNLATSCQGSKPAACVWKEALLEHLCLPGGEGTVQCRSQRARPPSIYFHPAGRTALQSGGEQSRHDPCPQTGYHRGKGASINTH